MGFLVEGKLGEHLGVKSEVMTISSSTAISSPVDMAGCRKALFICSMGTAVGGLQPVLQVKQSANATGSTWGNITSATALMGSSAVTRVDKATKVLLTCATVSTIGDVFVINGTTFTNATARSATAKQYGSTVDTTAAGGLEQLSSSLAAAINSNLSSVMTATTQTTATIRLTLLDGVSTYIDCVSTGITAINLVYEESMAMVEVDAMHLDSTSRYIALSLGTVATAIAANVCVIKDGVKPIPAYVQGTFTKLL